VPSSCRSGTAAVMMQMRFAYIVVLHKMDLTIVCGSLVNRYEHIEQRRRSRLDWGIHNCIPSFSWRRS